MSQTGSNAVRPNLRLIGGSRTVLRRIAAPAQPGAVARQRAEEVASENRAASGLSVRDARWVLAVRVAESLEGGRAAILPPEKRRALVAQGVRFGLRTFDANLVIAIVQDAARTGDHTLSRDVEDRLTLVRSAGGVREGDDRSEGAPWARGWIGWWILGALTLSAVMASVAVRWISGA